MTPQEIDMTLNNDLKDKKPIFGFDVTVKKIKNKRIKTVYVSSNFYRKSRLEMMANTFGVKLVEVKENSKELGILCKKPFAISVIGFE